MTAYLDMIFGQEEPIEVPVGMPVGRAMLSTEVAAEIADSPSIDDRHDAVGPTCLPLPQKQTRNLDEQYPIIPGTEHWDCFHDPEDLKSGRWGREFIPGFHRDDRQPSDLRSLLLTQTVAKVYAIAVAN